jgi:hypothetical protein
MTGAVMTLAAAGGVTGSSGVTTPGSLAWTAIYDTDSGSTNTQAFTGLTSPIAVSAMLSGGGALYYNLNASYQPYAGAFAVRGGDTLSWALAAGHLSRTGLLTIVNATTSTTLATIAYSVDSSWTGTGFR